MAEEEVRDVRVELRFAGAKAFPAGLVADVTAEVERAVYEAEVEEIDELQKDFEEVPGPVFDAMRYRADRYRGRTLSIETASSGSIVLEGAAVALALWLLNVTFGETIKDAWKKTKSHQRLKKTLSSRLERKAKRIAQRVRPRRYRYDDAEVQTRVEKRERAIVVVVLVTPEPALIPLPTTSEVLDEKDA
jgi:hypothetical protein